MGLAWDAVAGAGAYTVYRQDPGGPVHAIARVTGTSYVDPGASCGVRARYWVTASDALGESAFSLPVAPTAPACSVAGRAATNARPWNGIASCSARGTTLPRPTSPANCSALSAFQTALQWTNPPGATQYHLRVLPVGSDGPGLDLIRNVEGANTSFPIAAAPSWYFLLPDMTYTWSVRTTTAREAIGPDDPRWGPWSPAWGFRTPARTSAGLTPAAPAHESTVPPGTVLLQWDNRDKDVFYYEVQVSGNPGFNADPATATSFVWWNLVHGGERAPLNSWQTPDLTPGTTYYWRVRPRVQGDGTPVAWSPTWSFTVRP